MQKIGRRAFLSSAAGATLAGSLGCGDQDRVAGPSASRELRAFVYAGAHEQTMREVFVPQFEAATGASVTLFPGWWDGVPKLKTAPANDPPFDLLITDATQGFPAARDGLFREIDFANTANVQTLAPKTLDHWIYRDRLGLPYPDSVMTLAYHSESVSDPPGRWADLFRPELEGKLGLYSSFYMSLFTFAAALADLNGQAGKARELLSTHPDEVFEFARERRASIKFWWPTSGEMILALGDRTVAAGNMHSPEYLLASRERAELGSVVPALDRAMVQVFWAIPAGAPDPRLSEQALDLLFSEEVQFEFARRGMATSSVRAAERMAALDPAWASLYPCRSQDFDAELYYPYDFYERHWDDFADRWDRTILRNG